MGKLVTDPQIVQATFNDNFFRPGLEEGGSAPPPTTANYCNKYVKGHFNLLKLG